MTGPINLGQVVFALEPGGSEILARRIAGGLNRKGEYACSMYAVDHGGPLAESLMAEGIPATAFSRENGLEPRLVGQMARRFRADKIQVVHTHHLCQLLYGGLAGRLVGARVVHTEHEFYSLGARRAQFLLRVASALADVVTTVAEPVTEFLRDQVGIPGRKLRTVPNGVDVHQFQFGSRVGRPQLGWTDEDVIIACIARLEPEKEHLLLLEAFRRVHTRLPQTRLLIVGDGSERERLVSTVAALGLNDAVRFLGARDDVPALLRASDIVTLASRAEGVPLAVLEAMAASKPVVCTGVGNLPLIVQNGSTGFVVAPGDAEALTESLAVLVASPRERERMGARGLEWVSRHHSFDRTLEQYEAAYATALERKAN